MNIDKYGDVLIQQKQNIYFVSNTQLNFVTLENAN